MVSAKRVDGRVNIAENLRGSVNLVNASGLNTSKDWKVRFVFALSLLLFWGTGLVRAASVTAQGASVFINGSRVLTLRTKTGNMGPSSRAAMLAANIEKVASEGKVEIKRLKRTHQVLVDGHLVLTITREEAKANNTTTAALATQWAANIHKALLVPPLLLKTDPVRMPLGATRQVSVSGGMFKTMQVVSSDGAVVQTAKTETGISVKSVGYGKTEVVLTAGEIVKTFSVSVLPYATNFPQSHVAVVTGIPASEETVKGAIESILRTQLGSEANAKVDLQFPKVSSILPGESKTFTARVKATGPNMLDAEGPVFVTVKNLALGRVPEQELWYCNEPENLKQPGLLFVAPLRPETPARMLYHHINEMSQPLIVTVEAINKSDQPARVMVIPGDSSPDRNPVLAGVQAADQFIKGWSLSSGEVVEIPARSRLPIAMRQIAHGQTMSGLCYLRLLDEGPDQVTIRTEAKSPFPMDSRWVSATKSSTPWRILGSQALSNLDRDSHIPSIHIYPHPFKTEELTYQVGGRHGFFRIGEKAISRADKLDKLSGNFGVTYNLTATLENPTGTASDIELVFEASAGYSGALFVINGQLVRTPLLQPKAETQIAKFHLDAGASRTIQVMTVPLSGSSYPATLTIRSISTGAYARDDKK